MSNRKLKLALTVGLLNRKPEHGNILSLVKCLMGKFSSDAGSFMGLRQIEQQNISNTHTLNAYALDFEFYTLSLDIIKNLTNNTESINRLEFEAQRQLFAA